MRKPLSVLQAFQEDADGAAARAVELGPHLLDWVAAAQLACDLAAHVTESVPHASARVATLLDADPLLQSVSARRPSMVRDGYPAPDDPVSALAERLRVHAEAMEQNGCFELALTTVSAVCRITSATNAAAHSLATLHLGRIARQMSDFESAEDCYRAAISRALHIREPPIAARGHIGLALVQDMRGNFPKAIKHYRQALRYAVTGGGAWTQAHQGLMSIAVGMDQLGDALEHGWAVYDANDTDSETRASVLSELALVALKAGFPGPARQGWTHTLTISDTPRVRVLVWAGIARAAARMADNSAVLDAARQVEIEAARANLPHDRALALLRTAEALFHIGDVSAATGLLGTVGSLAQAHRFHELAWHAERLLEQVSLRETLPSVPAGVPSGVPSRRLRTAVERFATLG